MTWTVDDFPPANISGLLVVLASVFLVAAFGYAADPAAANRHPRKVIAACLLLACLFGGLAWWCR